MHFFRYSFLSILAFTSFADAPASTNPPRDQDKNIELDKPSYHETFTDLRNIKPIENKNTVFVDVIAFSTVVFMNETFSDRNKKQLIEERLSSIDLVSKKLGH